MTDATIRAVLDRYEVGLRHWQGGDARYRELAVHLRTMIPKMLSMLVTIDSIMDNSNTPVEDAIPVREKLMRWLGFMQGALWSLGIYTIDELRAHNKPEGEAFRERA